MERGTDSEVVREECLNIWPTHVTIFKQNRMVLLVIKVILYTRVQGGWGGWPTGNGKKLSSCQAQLGQATCLAVA